MKIVADTSWLIAHVNEDDRFHVQARRESKAAEVVHIPAAIWVEFQNVVQYRFGGHANATSASDFIRHTRNVTLGDRLDDETAQRVWRHHPKLTYSDAVAVAEAKRLGYRLASFERKQVDAFDAES